MANASLCRILSMKGQGVVREMRRDSRAGSGREPRPRKTRDGQQVLLDRLLVGGACVEMLAPGQAKMGGRET